MSEMVQASIYLHGVLPLMEDLVEYDPPAARAIANQRLVIQFEVRDGPAAHLEILEGRMRHGTGRHNHPHIRLTFRTPEQLNRLFAGENVRPGIRKGFTRLAFLTKGFPVLSDRLGYYLEGEGKTQTGPESDLFQVRLGLRAMLGGMAAVANYDPSLADMAAASPTGTLLVRVLPDGPHGTWAKARQNGGHRFVATYMQPVAHANAVMEFGSLAVARRVIDGRLSAVVAIGTGEMRIQGLIPLIEKANVFLGRFSRIMGRR
jgi:hypothetical protein